MAAPRWTYPITDIAGVEQVKHLPVDVDSFTDGLGVAEGQITFTVKVDSRTGLNYEDITEPMRRVIWPCYGGQPQGCYLITAESGYDASTRQMKMTGRRIDHLFDRREIWSTLVFRDVDQLVVARNLMIYALGGTPLNVVPGSMGTLVELLPVDFRVPFLHLDNTYSGVLRTREDTSDGYQIAGHKKVGAELRKLGELEDGFEYGMRYQRDPETGVLSATVHLGYPTFGADLRVSMEYPGRIAGWKYARDGTDMATAWRSFGPDAGGAGKAIGNPIYSARAAARGFAAVVESTNSNTANVAELDSRSRASLRNYDFVNGGITVELDGSALGTYQIGCVVDVKIADPRWPGGKLTRTVRITGHKIEPAQPGRATKITPSIEFV